jgi:predicted Zn finger-like uncharacterized protein
LRLICPNCAAQYEVTDDAIPEAGRDVQCANCGDTWFQNRTRPSLRKVPATANPPAAAETEADEDNARDEHQSEAVDEPEAPEQSAQPVESPDDDDDLPAAIPPRTPRPDARRANVDPSVLDILRSEVEHESAARGAETNGTSARPSTEDLDEGEEDAAAPASEPEDLASRARAARDRIRNHREGGRRIHFTDQGQHPEPEDEDEPVAQRYDDEDDDEEHLGVTPAPRRTERPQPGRTLPDVEELNSTLRSSQDPERARDARKEAASARKGGGAAGRMGFYLGVLIVLLALAAYSLQAQIIEAVPAAAPFLEMYTSLIDSARRGLAQGFDLVIGLVQDLLAKVL